MFTGLITDVGEVSTVETRGALKRVRIKCAYPAETVALGASIACAGPCLTVVGFGVAGNKSWFDVDIGAETLARTTAAVWKPGARLNLERSLKIGDELGGHIVTGHVDGIAEIIAIEDFDGMKRLFDPRARRARALHRGEGLGFARRHIFDGQRRRWRRLLHSPDSAYAAGHDMGRRRAGDAVNLEVDLMARYAARLSETARGVEALI